MTEAADERPDDDGWPDAAADDHDPDGVGADGAGRTGVAAADEARERLDALEDTDLESHAEIYEDAHRRLQEGLADLDEG